MHSVTEFRCALCSSVVFQYGVPKLYSNLFQCRVQCCVPIRYSNVFQAHHRRAVLAEHVQSGAHSVSHVKVFRHSPQPRSSETASERLNSCVLWVLHTPSWPSLRRRALKSRWRVPKCVWRKFLADYRTFLFLTSAQGQSPELDGGRRFYLLRYGLWAPESLSAFKEKDLLGFEFDTFFLKTNRRLKAS